MKSLYSLCIAACLTAMPLGAKQVLRDIPLSPLVKDSQKYEQEHAREQSEFLHDYLSTREIKGVLYNDDRGSYRCSFFSWNRR